MESEINLKEKAIRGTLWSAMQNFGGQGVSFVVFLILARMLSPVDVGLFAMTSVYLTFIQMVFAASFAHAVVQRERLDDLHLQTAFWSELILACGLFAVSWVGAGLIAGIYHEPRLVPVIRALALGQILMAVGGTHAAIAKRRFEYKSLAIRLIVASFAGGALAILAAWAGWKVWSLVVLQLGTSALSTVILWIAIDWRPKFAFSLNCLKEMLGFSMQVIGINLMNFVSRKSDDLIIGIHLGAAALGYYAVAYRILMAATLVITVTLNATAFPFFSRLQKDPERMRKAFYRATSVTNLIAIPVFVWLSALAPEIIRSFFGPGWEACIPIMQVLMLYGIFSAFHFNVPVIMATGKPGWGVALGMLQAGGNVLCFLWAVRYGVAAVAAALVLWELCLLPVTIWVLRRAVGIRIRKYMTSFLMTIIGAALSYGAVALVRHMTGGEMVLPIAAVLYLATAVAVYCAWLAIAMASELRQTALIFRTNVLDAVIKTIFPEKKVS